MADDRLSRIRAAATRPRRVVPILLDGAIRDQIEAVEDTIDALQPSTRPGDKRWAAKPDTARRDELVAEVERLREAARDMTIFVVIQALPATKTSPDDVTYREIVAAHPEHDENGKPVPGSLDHDAAREPLARACMVGHQESDDASVTEVRPFPAGYVDWLVGQLSFRQLDALAVAAIVVNGGVYEVPKPRPRSTTQTPDVE